MDCQVWAEQKAPWLKQSAGSEEAGLLGWGVRLRIGRVGAVVYAFAAAGVCPGGDVFALLF